MNIKLVLLRTGETVITNLSDMISPKSENFVGYFFENPCKVSVESVNSEDKENRRVNMSIRLIDWIPFSKEKKIPIAPDYVISIMDPIESLEETFINTYTK